MQSELIVDVVGANIVHYMDHQAKDSIRSQNLYVGFFLCRFQFRIIVKVF